MMAHGRRAADTASVLHELAASAESACWRSMLVELRESYRDEMATITPDRLQHKQGALQQVEALLRMLDAGSDPLV